MLDNNMERLGQFLEVVTELKDSLKSKIIQVMMTPSIQTWMESQPSEEDENAYIKIYRNLYVQFCDGMMLGIGGLAEAKQKGEMERYQRGLAQMEDTEEWIDSILERYHQSK